MMRDTSQSSLLFKRAPLLGRWLAVGVLGGLMAWGVDKASRGSLLPPGSPAPAFSWTRHDGSFVSLEGLRGKVVLLNFWSTVCPPCLREMPMLVSVTEHLASRGVVLVAANADEPGQRQSVVTRYLERKLPPLLPSVAYPEESGLGAYRVTAFPTTYVIGPDGRVRHAHLGELSEAQLRPWLEEALAP